GTPRSDRKGIELPKTIRPVRTRSPLRKFLEKKEEERVRAVHVRVDPWKARGFSPPQSPSKKSPASRDPERARRRRKSPPRFSTPSADASPVRRGLPVQRPIRFRRPTRCRRRNGGLSLRSSRGSFSRIVCPRP